MAIALSGTPVLSNSGGTTATSMTATLASTTVGALNIVAVSANTTGAAGDPAQSMPAGWTAVPGGSSGKTGSPWHRLSLFYRFFQSGDTNPTVTIAALGNIECACVAYSGVDSTTPFVTGEVLAQTQGASSTSWSTGSITTAALRWIISVFGNRTNGTWSALTDTQRLTGIVASSANIAYEDSNGTVAAGTIAARTATFSAATSVGNTVIVALNPAGGTSYSGSAALTSGSTLTGAVAASLAAAGDMTSGSVLAGQPGVTGAATLTSGSSLSGSSVIATLVAAGGMISGSALTGSVTASRPVSGGMTSGSTFTGSVQTPIVAQLASAGPQWPAHRDGTYATYGEETLEGYTAAAAQYTKALLEISVWDTSDGVYVCSHDSTTGRVFSGTNRTINSTTWATFSPGGSSTVGRPTTLVGGNPMRRLEEILDAFPTGLFVVENKHGTNQATLSTLLDLHAPGRWMFKGPYNDTANAVTAAGHGAPMWLYFYPSQLGSLSTTYSAVSSAGVPVVFGLGDYSTAPVPVQSDANTFFAFTAANGVKTWAHILGTTAQKTTADGQATTAGAAFDGYMTSSFPTLAPNDSSSAAMTSGSTLAGAVTASLAATDAMTSGSALAGSVAAVKPTTSGMTSGSTLGGSPTASVVAASGMASGSTLTGAPTVTVPESAGMTSGSVLTGAVQKSTAGSSGMISGSALTGQPTAVLQAAGTMVSGSALVGSVIASVGGTAGMVSASALTGGVSATDTAAAGMASASALTGSGTTGAAGAMQSASSLAGTATAALGASGGMVSGGSLTGSPARVAQSFATMASGSSLTGSVASSRTGAAGMTSLSSFATVTAAQLSAMAAMQSASQLTGMAAAGNPAQDIIFTAALGPQTYRFTAALTARSERFTAPLATQSHRFTAALGGQP